MKHRGKRLLILILCCCLVLPGFAEEGMQQDNIQNAGAVDEVSASEEANQAEPVYSTLSSGSKGEAVIRLQTRLQELGYYTKKIDGDFGSGTKAAVLSFQRRNGLAADGIAGPETQAALFREDALAAPDHPEPTDVLATDLPILLNHDHTVDEYFLPADLVLMTDLCDASLVKIKYPSTQAVRTVVEALVTMLEAAKADGITKWQVSAAYRSYSDQERILNAKINTYLNRNEGWSRSRARSAALKTVAEPGHSEHHLGLAIDINVPGASSFLGTKQCTWLHEHCWEYGFIVRYPSGKEAITGFTAEAWHIRYVGAAHALYMRDHDLCLEEYLEGIENGTIDPPLEVIEEVVVVDEE